MNLLTRFGIMAQTVSDGKTYLYNAGDECTTLTGGWAKAFSAGASSTYTENASDITMNAVATSDTGADMSTAAANTINLTNYTKLKMKFSGALSVTNSLIGLNVLNTTNNYFQNTSVAKIEIKLIQTYTDEIIELDVTNLNGSYYIGSEVYKTSTGGTNETLVLKQIWLE